MKYYKQSPSCGETLTAGFVACATVLALIAWELLCVYKLFDAGSAVLLHNSRNFVDEAWLFFATLTVLGSVASAVKNAAK